MSKYQRRCAKCNKATILPNTKSMCILYCTMKKKAVGKYETCSRFFYGGMDKTWVK